VVSVKISGSDNIMNKNKFFYLVDFLLLLVLVINILSVTLIKDFKVHEFSGYFFLVLTVAHMLQHGRWIISTTKSLFK